MTTAAILRFRLPSSKSPIHTLRMLCVATFPLAFIFLLVHGIVSKCLVPSIGLVPLFLSSIYSAFLLYNDRAYGGGQSGVLSGTPLHLLIDLLLSLGLLAVLILSWIFVPKEWAGGRKCWRGAGFVMFGTYCTVFMMVNAAVHFYFTLTQLADALSGLNLHYGHSCPHCNCGARYAQPGRSMVMGKGKDQAYTPLMRDEESRGDFEERGASSDGGESGQETGFIRPGADEVQ